SSMRGDGTRLTPPFEGDIIEASLSLEATTHTTGMFANYGVTDRWDIGVAVPFVRVNLDARVQAVIVRLVTCSTPRMVPTPAPVTCAPDTHTFEYGAPNATQTVQHSGQASGLGDIVLRTKYHFLRAAGGGLAAAVDVRLPTGDENELLGAGGAQAKFLLVMSTERGRLGQHVNIGYTAAGGEVAGTVAGLTSTPLPDEINYSGGVEFVANPRVTVMGDIVGRTLRGAGRLDLVSKTFEYSDPFRVPGMGSFTPQQLVELGILSFPTSSVSLDEFNPRSGELTLLLGTGGVKYNIGGNLLISGSVLFPLTDAGLRSRLTTVIGLDYAF
ncbi:MAG: transporter, partial [bacterium]